MEKILIIRMDPLCHVTTEKGKGVTDKDVLIMCEEAWNLSRCELDKEDEDIKDLKTSEI